MKMVVTRDGVRICPDGPMDEAYIEDTLKLLKNGDSIQLVRVNVDGKDEISYVETRAKK